MTLLSLVNCHFIFAGSWNVDGNGNWQVNANWIIPGMFPNSVDDTAILGPVGANLSNRTITILAAPSITLGNINFSGSRNYIINGPGNLTFDVSVGNATLSSTGTAAYTINAEMIFNDTVQILQSATLALSLAGNRSGTGGLVYNGPNILNLSGLATYTGATFINNGQVGYSNSLALPAGGTVNLGDGMGAVATAVLNINSSIAAAAAFFPIIASDGRLFQGNNRLVRITGLAGSGQNVLNTIVGNGFDVQFEAGNTVFNGILSGGITMPTMDPNAGSRLLKNGASTLTLTNDNTLPVPGFVARTFITTGSTIIMQNNGALGSSLPNSAVGIFNGGTLAIDGMGLDISKRIFLNSSGAAGSGALRNISGNNTVSGLINVGWVVPPLGPPVDATIAVDAGTLTLTGIVQGPRALIKTGPGTLILANNANAWLGGTIVNSGVLEGNTGTLPGDFITNATLRFFQGFNATFSGVISGSGIIEKTGAGELTLTALNTYSGANVLLGALIGTTDSLKGPISNGSLLTFDQGFDGVFSSNISGIGDLVKFGTGKVTFTSSVDQSGGISIQQGEVEADGLFNGGIGGVDVFSGASLSGIGTLGGLVDISGTVSPGQNSTPATLQSNFNTIFRSGSSFHIDFNQMNADLYNVLGTAFIEPGATLILDSAACSDQAFNYTILQAAGGLSGVFDTVVYNCPMFPIGVQYNANNLVIFSLIKPLPDLVSMGNPGIVANYLNQQDAVAGTDLFLVIEVLSSAPNSETLFNWLNELHPAPYNGFFLLQQSRSLQMSNLLSERSFDLYRRHVLDSCLCDGKWGVWAAPVFDYSVQDTYHNLQGYRAKSATIPLGFDFALSPRFYLGFSTAYAYTDLDFLRGFGTGSINSINVSVYGAVNFKQFLFDASVLGGYDFGRVRRKISFSSIHRTAKSHPGGGFFDLHGGLTFLGKIRSQMLNPSINLDYFYANEQSYKETGANSLNLNIKSKQATLLRFEGGLEWTMQMCSFKRKIVPSLGLNVIREWRFRGRSIVASMEGGQGSFRVYGMNPDRTLVAPKVGFLISMPDQSNLTLNYNGEYGKHYQDSNFNLTLDKCF